LRLAQHLRAVELVPARQSGSESSGVIGGRVWLSLDLAKTGAFGIGLG